MMARRYNALLQQLHSADAALATVRDAVIQTDPAHSIVHMNTAAERMTGWSSEELMGRPISDALGLGAPAGADDLTVRRGQPLPEGVFKVLRPRAGSERMVLVAVSDHPHGRVYVLRDDTAELAEVSGIDSLTGLPGRQMLEQRLVELLGTSASGARQLLYLDLDQFKVINDMCGHRAGDDLLCRLTGQWQAVLEHGELLARLGGDEFCVVLTQPDLASAHKVGERLIGLAGDLRFEWAGETFRIGASGGLVDFVQHHEPDALLAAAHCACWAAKEGGRNRLQVFDYADHALMSRQKQMAWLTRITRALEEDRFVLYHQEIHRVDGRHQRGLHCEILLRMLDEDGGLILPGQFIPAAERYSVMPRVDRWVVTQVFQGLARRMRANPGAPLGTTAINLSGTTFSDKKFIGFVNDLFGETGIPPCAITFELTETAAISDIESARHFIDEMRRLGCGIALDDFGSGLSSFAYLRTLGVDFLKIDGAFVRDIHRDPVSFAMVEAIHRVGQVMGIPTVAEFVDDPGISACLRKIGVDFAQGHGLHLPEPWPWGRSQGLDLELG